MTPSRPSLRLAATAYLAIVAAACGGANPTGSAGTVGSPATSSTVTLDADGRGGSVDVEMTNAADGSTATASGGWTCE